MDWLVWFVIIVAAAALVLYVYVPLCLFGSPFVRSFVRKRRTTSPISTFRLFHSTHTHTHIECWPCFSLSFPLTLAPLPSMHPSTSVSVYQARDHVIFSFIRAFHVFPYVCMRACVLHCAYRMKYARLCGIGMCVVWLWLPRAT